MFQIQKVNAVIFPHCFRATRQAEPDSARVAVRLSISLRGMCVDANRWSWRCQHPGLLETIGVMSI